MFATFRYFSYFSHTVLVSIRTVTFLFLCTNSIVLKCYMNTGIYVNLIMIIVTRAIGMLVTIVTAHKHFWQLTAFSESRYDVFSHEIFIFLPFVQFSTYFVIIFAKGVKLAIVILYKI